MRQALRQIADVPDHLGLAYDAWAPVGAGGKVPDDKRAGWLSQLADVTVSPDYGRAFARWKSSFAAPADRLFEVTLTSRLLLGHGNASATDIGLALHHTWGVPVIPGSALKGLLAHYVDAVYGPADPSLPSWEQPDSERDRARYQGVTWHGRRVRRGPGEVYRALFGAPDADEDGVMRERAIEAGASTGRVVFHDALYVPGSVADDRPYATDVLTVHQKSYYSSSGGSWPSDYDSPNPVAFLTVRPGAAGAGALMARTADGRRRGKKTGGEAPRPPEPASPRRRAEPPAARPAPPRREEPRTEWVSREEPLVFPVDAPAAAKAARIALPSSGLAEDILAMADAAQVTAEPAVEETPLAAMTPAAPSSATPSGDAARRAHNISFFASPVREERKAAEPTEHLATFFLAREEYGVDVRMVQEIIRVSEITQVPRAPEFIKGVINLRGRIIPVVDLKRKLNLGDVEAARQARIVVVKLRDRLIGLLVDGASQVLKVPLSVIEQAPEEVVEIDANYIRGVAKMADRLIILLDLNKVLSLELREGPGGV